LIRTIRAGLLIPERRNGAGEILIRDYANKLFYDLSGDELEV